MNAGSITVIRIVVTIAWCKVKTASHFFIVDNIGDGSRNHGVNANCKLTNIARTFIGIQDLVHALGGIAAAINNLAVFEGKLHVLKM